MTGLLPQVLLGTGSTDQPAEESLKKRREKLASAKLGIEPSADPVV